MKDPYRVIKNPITTEKAVRLMESQNKLTFIIDRDASKPEIKEAIEKAFKVKIVKINTLITPKGTKKAYIKLAPETPALDVATQLGLI
ncbi:MAG: 50S ribosomal protein L23 [Nanoarchaeota archaeon]